MIGAVVENFIGGYLHPRASVRRLLDAGHGLDAMAQMATLAFLLRMIFIIVVPGARPDVEDIHVGWYLMELATFLVVFALLSVMVYSIGRYFGGKGTLLETGMTLSWYLLVTTIIDLLFLTALVPIVSASEEIVSAPANPVDIPGWAIVVLMVSMGIATWLFASFVAELHRFARTWNVLMAMVGLSMAFGLAAALVMQLA
jgi:hypothetical protein